MEVAEKLITENLDVWTSAVKPKSSAGKGSGKKRELYGITKLRNLILELAVRGLLTPSDIKWALEQFGEIFDIQGGTQPPKSQFIFEPQDGYVRLLQIRDLGEKPVPTFIPEESARRFCDENDILIGRYGASVGKIFKGQKGAYNVALAKLIWNPDTFAQDFLITWLKSAAFQDRLAGASRSAQAGFNKGDLASIQINYPPLAEQHRIVAKVDELMALCDQLEQEQESSLDTHDTLVATLLGALTTATADAGQFAQAWQRIQANFDTLFTTESSIDQLKQTILQLAVMGKLVPQDKGDEPATELLGKIADERSKLIKEKKIKKQKPLPPITPDETPFEIPDQWEWCKFGLIGEFINGDRSKNYPNKSEYVESGMPWINTGHIEPNGTLTKSSMNFITMEKYDSLRGGKIEPGDLVYCLRGATFGKTAFITPYAEGAIASSLMIIRPHIKEFGDYLFRYLISPFGRSQIFRFDNGSAQPNLSANSVKMYAFPLPPLAEQHRIVAEVDELMALCDQLKASLTTAQTTQLNLTDSLVEQAIV